MRHADRITRGIGYAMKPRTPIELLRARHDHDHEANQAEALELAASAESPKPEGYEEE